ncbi:MAG TPA: pentapeptide repeat-containing protein, partial [Bacteroidales bacterium]|nr:pentapeptide repeat-containing protein [Bacteroidales bacterium]
DNYEPRECFHCFEQGELKVKIKEYISQRNSVVRATDETKVTDVTIKPNLLAYTPMDQNTISIIMEYFGSWWDFKDSNLSGLNLSGLNLKGYSFTDCNFDGCNLSSCDLSQVVFTNCSMIRTRLDNITTKNTHFNKCVLNGAIFTGLFNNVTMSETSLIYARFKEAVVTDSTINKCEIAKSRFRKTYLDNCSFISLDMTTARFLDTSLVNSRIIRTILADLNLDGMDFSGSTLTLSNLHSCSLIGAKFNKCNFTAVFMMKVNASEAIFNESTFQCTDLSGSNLRQASFLDITLNECTVKDTQFKGAIFTSKYTLARSFFDGVASRP